MTQPITTGRKDSQAWHEGGTEQGKKQNLSALNVENNEELLNRAAEYETWQSFIEKYNRPPSLTSTK